MDRQEKGGRLLKWLKKQTKNQDTYEDEEDVKPSFLKTKKEGGECFGFARIAFTVLLVARTVGH